MREQLKDLEYAEWRISDACPRSQATIVMPTDLILSLYEMAGVVAPEKTSETTAWRMPKELIAQLWRLIRGCMPDKELTMPVKPGDEETL